MIRITQGRANVQLFNAVNQHNVACLGSGHHLAFKAFEFQNLVNARFSGRALRPILNHHILQGF